MPHHAQPLRFLLPGWYALVMGLAGLALAWQRATPLMGELAGSLAKGATSLATLVFAALALATLLRARRYPEAWADDCRHPVRHSFVAALPISVILLATLAVALHGPVRFALWLWWAGALAQLGVTLWGLARWLRGNGPGGLKNGVHQPPGLVWASATPALLMPVVGNLLVPLAGVPLGQADWSAAQFGIGLMFWPVVTGLIVVRIAVQGLWPERLLPTAFLFIAPPAVGGLATLQLGAPPALAWALWGMALFGLLWMATLARRIAALPFGLPHWGMSFPLAALSALTLRLATPGGLLAVLGPALLALTTLVTLALLLGTLRGLRDGSLLAPEPMATIVPATP